MSIAKDFRAITKQLDDVLALAFELDHPKKRKRPAASRAQLGKPLTKDDQRVLVLLRGAVHPTVVELMSVAAGAVWPLMPVRTFLALPELLVGYPDALARQERLSAHKIDGLLLATSGHMAYLAAKGASLVLFVGGKKKKFASVNAFLAFIKNDVEERAAWARDALKDQRKVAKRSKRIGGDVLAEEADLVDAISDPPKPRSPEGRAYVLVRTMRMYAPEGELVDKLVNDGVAPYVAAARFAKLSGLVTELNVLARVLNGKTFAARRKQMDSDKARAALDDVEAWLEVHTDDVTHALAKIAKPWPRW